MSAPGHEAPRQRILDAALELLAEHGYEGMSLQQVADRVGLHVLPGAGPPAGLCLRGATGG